MTKTLFGVDQFCALADDYKDIRIGLVTNDVARNAFGEKTRVALIESGFKIVKLFSPEHGLTASAADGAWVPNIRDELTHLPVVSLYADKLRPTAEDLQEIDAIVFDIPDVGCRFYTYLWTMTHIMEACAEHHKQFIVLDRANPLSGDLAKAEGPMLDAACSSFLGRWNIPLRHSCTLGELAKYFTANHIPNLDIQIIKIQNWNRNDFPNKGNWDFVPTSPAIKDAETALLYPGLGLLEGINVNEGRGTETDFKVLGAPWIDSAALKSYLDRLNLSGIAFSTTQYIPEWGLYQNEFCNGVSLRITDEQIIRPVSLGIEILKYLIQNYPNDCTERLYKTNANPTGGGHLDKLLGVQHSFNSIKNNIPIQTKLHKEQWQDLIEPYLLY
ncbi:MAG: DUF1343 domain-containing protein [Balneolaceae bacterium]